jgi:hypothetical protein
MFPRMQSSVYDYKSMVIITDANSADASSVRPNFVHRDGRVEDHERQNASSV